MTKINIKVQIRCNCKTIMIKRREVEKINLQVSPKDKPEAQWRWEIEQIYDSGRAWLIWEFSYKLHVILIEKNHFWVQK
jgi:hypothetical protein